MRAETTTHPPAAPGPEPLRREAAGAAHSAAGPSVRPPFESGHNIGALLARCALDDTDAFERLYEQVSARVHGVVVSIVRDPARSDEVTQEVFSQIWTNAEHCDVEHGSPIGWVISIARRRAIDCVRSEAARRRRDEIWLSDLGDLVSDDPGDVVVSRSSRQQVIDALARLPVEQSMLIRMAFFEGLTHRELAAKTGLPMGTVKYRVRAGMRALAHSLAPSSAARDRGLASL